MMARLGQINLFTKRVSKAPSALEVQTHIAIADLLRIGLAPRWLWFHPPNGGWRATTTGGLLKRMGARRGASDFILIGHGHPFAMELKREGEKPTPEQLAFGRDWQTAGGTFAWVDTYKAAEAQLRLWGALKDSVHT
jgi:hypothetical protein